MTETDTKTQPLRLGGMALRNGLLVHGPSHWSAAVRKRDGTIAVATGRKPRVKSAAADLPLARGVVRLGEAMAVIPLVKRALPEARLPFQDKRVLLAMAAATVGAGVLRGRVRGPGGEAALAGGARAPARVALSGGDLAAYHGVEHKAIAAYEQGDPQDARAAAKEHDRCGSHLMAPLLAANSAGAALLRKVIASPTPAHGAAIQLASLGIAVEVFAWSERHAGTATAKALRRPGHELQRLLGTREPTDDQLAVGAAALDAILRAEGALTAGK